MANFSAFQPQGQLVTLAASTTPTVTPVQLPDQSNVTGRSNVGGMLVTNTGSVVVFLYWGVSSAEVTANMGTLPAAGTNVKCYPLYGPSQVTLNLPANAFFGVVAQSSTATIYLQAGDGV